MIKPAYQRRNLFLFSYGLRNWCIKTAKKNNNVNND